MSASDPASANNSGEQAHGASNSTSERRASMASKYRGTTQACSSGDAQATVEDLDLSPALSTSPTSPISHALMSAFERDYTHLTVISPSTRALLGYLSIPYLRDLLKAGTVEESDPVERAMMKFKRKGRTYKVIDMETPLEELEDFFDGGAGVDGGKQEFAVVTDAGRRFVLGVATKGDLEEFVRRRPA
ncbi:NEDD8 activating enzyme [Elasticomyces elasticus]|nr:NEDD8 activating enzyme [Elasticomyces elasticus]